MKYDAKRDWRRLFKSPVRVVLALVVVALLLAPVAVQGDLKANNSAYAFDIQQGVNGKFQQSNVTVAWDGSWVPFLEQLYFDTDVWSIPGCGASNGTRWAGNMYYILYHLDDNPLGGLGFQESRNWSLISCDRNGDGSFDGADLEPPPSPYDRGEYRGTLDPPGAEPWKPYAECTADGPYCKVISQDIPQWCDTGNCELKIVTTLLVNLDLDCLDGVDDLFPVDGTGQPDMLCFYAEARTPTELHKLEPVTLPEDPPDNWDPALTYPDDYVLPYPLVDWGGPIQARIDAVGGDQTVTFRFAPTAVGLAAFDAASQDGGVLLTWETASETDNLGFNIYRAEAEVGELIKINPNLIPSKNLGSSMGAAYSFLDESAVLGATYYYWLEDLDMSGASEMHGPATAQAGAAKALPGRPRPEPMPGNAF